MKRGEQKELKKIIKYLLVGRSAGYVAFGIMIMSDNFVKEIFEPLKKLCRWNKKDEKETKAVMEKFKEIKGKTLREICDQLKKELEGLNKE